MKTYEQVLEKAELALSKGEYRFCIEYLSPIIESFPLSSKEGINLRTILVTALCGINNKKDAKKLCKELLKSYELKTRENAKYLMEIIDSPEMKKPENWNIKFEINTSLKKQYLESKPPKQNNIEEKKFINVIDSPTGETKPFKKGFTILIFFILLLLIPLLSGCVKIENTLDLTDVDSINNSLKIESKYINKFPWQIKFEEKTKAFYPDENILIDDSSFFLTNNNLDIKNTKGILKKIFKTAGDLAGGSTDFEINTTEKNFLFLKKYNYILELNLQTIKELDDLELYFKIIHPNKATFSHEKSPQLEISKNLIVWHLIPGKINTLEFAFWNWNKLLIGITFILLVIIMAYYLRYYRLKLGTDLPQLPSDL